MLTLPLRSLEQKVILLISTNYEDTMVTFDAPVAFADKLFGTGFITDVYFDLHAGDSNLLVVTTKELREWIVTQCKAMAADVVRQLETNGSKDAEILCQTLQELTEHLVILEGIDPEIGGIVFHDGRLFK